MIYIVIQVTDWERVREREREGLRERERERKREREREGKKMRVVDIKNKVLSQRRATCKAMMQQITEG